MKEKALIAAIRNRLPKTMHHQSMTSASLTHTGTPDQYYDGPISDLWVEYKQLQSMPRSGVVDAALLLTPRQLRWVQRRSKHGQNAIICVGLPNTRALLFTERFDGGGLMLNQAVRNALSYDEIAKWICEFCGCS